MGRLGALPEGAHFCNYHNCLNHHLGRNTHLQPLRSAPLLCTPQSSIWGYRCTAQGRSMISQPPQQAPAFCSLGTGCLHQHPCLDYLLSACLPMLDTGKQNEPGSKCQVCRYDTQVQVFALSPTQEGRDILGGADTNPDTGLSFPLIWGGGGGWGGVVGRGGRLWASVVLPIMTAALLELVPWARSVWLLSQPPVLWLQLQRGRV